MGDNASELRMLKRGATLDCRYHEICLILLFVQKRSSQVGMGLLKVGKGKRCDSCSFVPFLGNLEGKEQ